MLKKLMFCYSPVHTLQENTNDFIQNEICYVFKQPLPSDSVSGLSP